MAIATIVAVGDVADPLVEAIKARLPKVKVGPGSDPDVRDGAARHQAAPRQGRVLPRVRAGPGRDASSPTAASTRSYKESDGFFLGVSLIDHVTPDDGRLPRRDLRPGPDGHARRDLRRGGQARQRQPVRQRHGDLHPRRRRGPPVPVRGRTPGMVGINVPIPVPVAYYSFGGWKASLFGDLHMYGPEGIQFYTRAKIVTSRWPDPGTSQGRPRLPADPLSRSMTQTTPRPDAVGLDRNARREHLRSRGWTPRPTLTGTDYTSEAVYAEERERVWFDGWVCIGRDEEFPNPGDFLVRDLAGESVFVTRNRAGELRAFYNVCAHRGTKLLDETGERAATSARPSSARTTPGRTTSTAGSSARRTSTRTSSSTAADYPLHAIAVGSYAGFLFVNLADAPEPLVRVARARAPRHHELRPLPDGRAADRRADRATRSRRTGRSSSRTTTSASTARRSIPELVPIVPLYRFGEVWDEETQDDGNWMIEGATAFTQTGRPTLPPLPGLEPRRLPHVLRHVPVPEPAAQPPPGLRDVLPALPAGARPHDGRLGVPVPARDDRRGRRSSPSPVVELWDLISKQDWAVCERAQTGVGSRAFKTGRLPAPGPLPVRLQRALPPRDGPADDRLSDGGRPV